MSFLVDINPKMELPKYKLTLHKLNEESIGSLKNITDFKISPLFVGIHNMSFNVPLYTMNSDGTNSRNYIYDLVEGDHLVKLNDMSYFIIVNVKEFADDDGNKYKEVQCKSREYGLVSKKLTDYSADSRVLYDPSDTMLDGLEKGILNYIFKYLTKSWTLDYVDPDLILREGKGIYRALNFTDSNLIQVFMELQKIFNCIFTFDRLNKKVSVYDIKNMMGQDRGLYISDTNFIKRITKDVNSDGIVTRLYLRGKDGVSIQSISQTGQPYIDNFEYYKNTKYMSQGLIDALNTYQTKVSGYNPDFEPLFVLLNQANTMMEGLLNADGINLSDKGLVALKTNLSQIQTLIDVKVEELGLLQSAINSAEGTDLSSLHATKKSIQSAMDALIAERTQINGFISNKESQITSQQSVIDGIENQIESLQYHLDTSNPDNFTGEQLKELDEFIKVHTFSDSNYTEHNLQELKEEGIRQLNRLSQPPIQFEVDSVDFLSIVQCQHIWKNFVLGDIVTLEHKEMGFKFVVRLVGYDHDVDSHSLNLKFSNTNSYDDATLYERDLMEHINNIGTTVDFNTDRWNDVGNVESRIAKLVDSKLEEARQNILKAVGQQHLFDDSGLWLYKENPDGTLDDAQIRAINSDIVLTDDNFATIKTAISAKDGINAELIRGKIGEFAQLSADQVRTGRIESNDNSTWINLDDGSFNFKDSLKWVDGKLSIDYPTMNDLEDKINNSMDNNYMTRGELESLILLKNAKTQEVGDIVKIMNSLGIKDGETTVVDDIISSAYIDVWREDSTSVDRVGEELTLKYSKNAGFQAVELTKREWDENEPNGWGFKVGKGNFIKVEFEVIENDLWSNEFYMGIDLDNGEGMYSLEDMKVQNGAVGYFSRTFISMSDELRVIFETRHENPVPSYDVDAEFKIRNLKISVVDSLNLNYSLSILESEINKYEGSPSYPTPITTQGRMDLQNALNQLNTMIVQANVIVGEKRDVDSIKENYNYNSLSISKENGLIVKDEYGIKRLQVGGIDTSGNEVKDGYGFKAMHEDGTFSALTNKGFMKMWPNGEAKYLNGIYTKEYTFNLSQRLDTVPLPIKVELPMEFKGREDSTEITLIPTKYEMFISNPLAGSQSDGAYIYSIVKDLDVRVEVDSKYFNAAVPYVNIDSYMGQNFAFYDGGDRIDYYRVNFLIMVVGI